jgi:hypothetical protein
MPFFPRTRRPSCDLEPVETTEAPAPEEQSGTVKRRRPPMREPIGRWLASRPDFARLTPAEQREHTEDRANRVAALIAEDVRAREAHSVTDPLVLADDIARTWGLSADDRERLRPFAERAISIGLDQALTSLDASQEVDNRLRCAIALVLQTTFRR